MTHVHVELPDHLMEMFEPGRVALIALALEAYQSEVFTQHQIGILLGLSRFAVEGLLKEHQIEFGAYGVEDLANDLASIAQLKGRATG